MKMPWEKNGAYPAEGALAQQLAARPLQAAGAHLHAAVEHLRMGRLQFCMGGGASTCPDCWPWGEAHLGISFLCVLGL